MGAILVPESGDFGAWSRRHEACIAVDWDGTCKDTMVPKWTRGFNLAIAQVWPQLASRQKRIDDVCYDVNLVDDRTAGVQRFVALKIMMGRWAAAGLPVPELDAFFRAVDDVEARGDTHGVETYRRLQGEYGYDDSPLRWSDLSDRIITDSTRSAVVFDNCRGALEAAARRADLLVVSASKTEAVRQDLLADGMEDLFAALLAQDFLPKPGILRGLAERYGRVLFVGDTQHDIRAAASAGVPIYRIRTGEEAASWSRATSVFERFLDGRADLPSH